MGVDPAQDWAREPNDAEPQWAGDRSDDGPGDRSEDGYEDGSEDGHEDSHEDGHGLVELPEPPQTGEPGVDEAVARLSAIGGATLEDQLPVLESVHRTLQDRLADVDG